MRTPQPFFAKGTCKIASPCPGLAAVLATERAQRPRRHRRSRKIGIVAIRRRHQGCRPATARQSMANDRCPQARALAGQCLVRRRARLDAKARVGAPIGKLAASGQLATHEAFGGTIRSPGTAKCCDRVRRVPDVRATLQPKVQSTRRPGCRQRSQRIGDTVVDGARRELARKQKFRGTLHCVPHGTRRTPSPAISWLPHGANEYHDGELARSLVSLDPGPGHI